MYVRKIDLNFKEEVPEVTKVAMTIKTRRYFIVENCKTTGDLERRLIAFCKLIKNHESRQFFNEVYIYENCLLISYDCISKTKLSYNTLSIYLLIKLLQ